ncbi:MAG: hypothetical protein PHG95_03050 [Patescibacteria group bacterium]|nr:hypothetical protein [Patescibacteria group bacterium]
MPNKKIVIAVENTYEAITGVINNKLPNLKIENTYFIKTSDLTEWAQHKGAFIIKSFGDGLSNYFINFIYKDGDEDLKAQKLEREIKIALFLKELKKDKHD